jgi:hypothetical protein
LIDFKLLNSVLSERAEQGIQARKRTNPIEGFTSRRDTVGVVFAYSERNLRWLGSLWVPLPAWRLRGLGSLKAVTEWVASRVRDNRSQTAVTNYP